MSRSTAFAFGHLSEETTDCSSHTSGAALSKTTRCEMILIRSIAALLFTALPVLAGTKAITGKCVGVHDGDTITVLAGSNSQVKVRLAGIDAPEIGQAFGQKAKQALSERVFGKEVTVRVVDRDRYGRTVGDVYTGTNWINKAMIETGMAWHYVQFSKSAELTAAEKTAREQRLGLWADKEPVPPWEWRKHD